MQSITISTVDGSLLVSDVVAKALHVIGTAAKALDRHESVRVPARVDGTDQYVAFMIERGVDAASEDAEGDDPADPDNAVDTLADLATELVHQVGALYVDLAGPNLDVRMKLGLWTPPESGEEDE